MSTSTSTSTSTIAFFGASGGCGLSALKHALSAGHTCIALCRNPSKLDAHFPSKPANLIVKPGNAHSVDDVLSCLTKPSDPLQLVDAVYFTIGGLFNPRNFTIDDPDVCGKGIVALYDALDRARRSGGEHAAAAAAAAAAATAAQGTPLLVIGSTTGISTHKRDVPLLFVPMYHVMLKVPHADKKAMEKHVVGGRERYILVRPSFLCDGAKAEREIRVGVEDPVEGVERAGTGYFISREDVGRWVYEKCLAGGSARNEYEGKAVGISW